MSILVPQNERAHILASKVLDELSHSFQQGAEITRDQVDATLENLPFVLVADDDDCVRSALYRIVANKSLKNGSAVVLNDEMEKNFRDAFNVTEAGKIPVILGKNGNDADLASQLICQYEITDALLIHDFSMGGPTGLETFNKYALQYPERITRVLASGTPPSDVRQYLDSGILDLLVVKPPNALDMRAKVAEAYLKRYRAESDHK